MRSARKTSCRVTRGLTLFQQFLDGPLTFVSVHLLGCLPTMPRGNGYVVLFIERSSHRCHIDAIRDTQSNISIYYISHPTICSMSFNVNHS